MSATIPQSRMDDLVILAKYELSKLVGEFVSGNINSHIFILGMESILRQRHSTASALGRMRAGDPLQTETEDDLQFAMNVMDGEKEYLDRFENALDDDYYLLDDGDINESAIERRALSYTGKLFGTANETFVLASDDDAEFYWRLGDVVEDHCPDCPKIAADSPYLEDDLPTYPRQNDTQCLFHCSCYLERDDGLTCFQP